MDFERPTALLGGLSTSQFMRRHWQKKPLLVRQAIPDLRPPLTPAALFALAARDDVQARLVRRSDAGWQLQHGPFTRRRLPPLAQPGWSLLVQGVDLHVDAAHALLQEFRFLPDARLDDLMVSYASDGGGVGPHFDSYDVFLLQAQGRRRWSWGRQRKLDLVPGLPLKILAQFAPEHEAVLEPGDMLYLPPRYAHDGVAEGADCMTLSIGLRAPAAHELAADMLARIAQATGDAPLARKRGDPAPRYDDAAQPAARAPAAIPAPLQAFARAAMRQALREPGAVARALGESLTEPKPLVWFDAGAAPTKEQGVALHRATRMLYDARHIYINGESYRAAGRDAVLLRQLADRRHLPAQALARCSRQARALLREWSEAGWLHAD